MRRTGSPGGVEWSNELPHEGQSPPRPTSSQVVTWCPWATLSLPTMGVGAARFKNQLKTCGYAHRIEFLTDCQSLTIADFIDKSAFCPP